MYGSWSYNKERARNWLIQVQNDRKKWEEEHPNPTDITWKQKETIDDIEFQIGQKFEGKTRKEASEFIGKGLEKIKELKKEKKND